MSCKTLQGKYAEKLEKENQELNDSITWWTNRFKAVERDNRELHEKIDKAIEFIKRSAGYKGICTQPETDTFSKLLEILGDKDE